ncbi:peptidyl-prolyl cis-trans isomerase CYP59 isoform X1 [Eucalyptus grandis]|uniref:peptidyl-prolyl cis-trans isomerase CYP59 isoform X1 n=1 Tax=Eucalyptus grandis TaxID=71139 RepID=UPI00192EFEB7|nr:peptidyl-prolyl cis-trans isomerase CYP59 isoform X1 [Eucalyptus grandis]
MHRIRRRQEVALFNAVALSTVFNLKAFSPHLVTLFYFTLRDDLDYLNGKHTVFGEVAEGLETFTRINEAYVDEKGRPYKNIRIRHTYILDDPFDDPPQLAELIPDASPEGKPKDEAFDDVRLEDDWVPMDEQLGPAQLEEAIRAKEAHSRAVVLESIGDIPDAEIKPPDNVLFVCKLNPVTEDEDLRTIFSRFGSVVSADVIRDFKTGDSLCYAFIEFENKDSYEQAYFKMDNALIDDGRIKVDFSQSVAKLWSQFKRKDSQTAKGKDALKLSGVPYCFQALIFLNGDVHVQLCWVVGGIDAFSLLSALGRGGLVRVLCG